MLRIFAPLELSIIFYPFVFRKYSLCLSRRCRACSEIPSARTLFFCSACKVFFLSTCVRLEGILAVINMRIRSKPSVRPGVIEYAWGNRICNGNCNSNDYILEVIVIVIVIVIVFSKSCVIVIVI